MTPSLHAVLDHVGVVVGDLDQARDAYLKLGFQLTAKSSHKGPLKPGGPVEPWGSGNYCAMFRDGYYEILGITDAALRHDHIDARLQKYQGLHLIALGVRDAEAAHRHLAAAGAPVKPVRVLQRDVPYGDGTRLGRFGIVNLDDSAFPEAELFFIEQATREVLWQESLLHHPNGVQALAAITLCVAEPALTAGRLEALLGTRPVQGEHGWTVPLAHGHIEVIDRDGLEGRCPGVAPPRVPSCTTVTFRVADLETTAALLEDRGVPAARTEHGLLVPATFGMGAAVEFAA